MTLEILCLNAYLLPLFLSKDNGKRLKAIIKLIAEKKPDVIALQEVWMIADVKKITKALPEYEFTYSDNFVFNSSGLLTGVRKKEFEFQKQFNWGKNWSLVELLGGKGFHFIGLFKEFYIMNTHLYAPLSVKENEINISQVKEIASWFERRKGIVVGDLNIEQEYLFSTTNVFNTHFTFGIPTLSHQNPYANSRLNVTLANRRIDYVLATKDVSVSETVLSDIIVSDHYPILAKITF